jgi:hypothetical protein
VGKGKSKCAICVCVLILKFLREGKVSVEGTEFSCHDEAFLKAGISPVITNRNAVYLHFRLAHNLFLAV